MYSTSKKIKETEEKEYKSQLYVLKNAPDKYTNIIKQRTANWNEVAKELEDSLKLDSIIKKAYFEGQQSIRDSIKSVK